MSERNIEEVLEILLNHVNAEEAATVDLKHRIAKLLDVKEAVAVREDPFLSLKYERRTGNRLKEFEVATKTLNSCSEDFEKCLNILRRNGANIKDRFHCEGWKFSYWLYGENTIYRQTLKK